MMTRAIIWSLMILLPTLLWAQAERKYIREGNALYQSGKYKEAAEKYAEAMRIKKDYLAAYLNQGNAYYQQDSLELAIKQFELAASLSTDKDLKAKAYHNLGNAYLKAGKYEESIEAYKNALRNNPNDADTRYNLAYAQSKLQNQPPQDQDKEDQQKDKDKDNDKDDKSGEQDKDPQQNDQQKDDKGKKNDDPKNPKDGDKGDPNDAEKSKDEQDEKNMQPKPGHISKADLEKLLEALKNEELKVQEKLLRKDTPNDQNKIEKDW